ncbi:hypothetical protein BZA05DRAFT_423128 [Tricharina praecox]|nr:hypothetical protein BZA05DRAFT_423128 [Tricharina praecox]
MEKIDLSDGAHRDDHSQPRARRSVRAADEQILGSDLKTNLFASADKEAWAGENQLRLHAMELIQTLGLGQPGQRCDLRGLASALLSDCTLSLRAAHYLLQVSIQAPRFFRA